MQVLCLITGATEERAQANETWLFNFLGEHYLVSLTPNPKFSPLEWQELVLAHLRAFLPRSFFSPVIKIWSSAPLVLLKYQKYQGHEILVKKLPVTVWVFDWHSWQCTRYLQPFAHLARPICWSETGNHTMWLRLWSNCITLKSPFNRQSQVTPHLINSRLVHSLLWPTHISATESPTGAGVIVGITSRVKRSV